MNKMRVRIQINYKYKTPEIYTEFFSNHRELLIEINRLGTIDSFYKCDDIGKFVPSKTITSVEYRIWGGCNCELHDRSIYLNNVMLVDSKYIEKCMNCGKKFQINMDIAERKKEINKASVDYMLN